MCASVAVTSLWPLFQRNSGSGVHEYLASLCPTSCWISDVHTWVFFLLLGLEKAEDWCTGAPPHPFSARTWLAMLWGQAIIGVGRMYTLAIYWVFPCQFPQLRSKPGWDIIRTLATSGQYTHAAVPAAWQRIGIEGSVLFERTDQSIP